MITVSEVRKTVIEIMKNDFEICVSESMIEKHFFDESYDLLAMHMLHLVLKLEKIYSIKFTEEELLDKNLLYTMDSICRLVSKKSTLQ